MQLRSTGATGVEFRKFCDEFPAPQNAVDIFKGHWASSLPGDLQSGDAHLFTHDPRPEYAAKAFGSLSGMRILELGPLEAAHTFQLEKLGAQVTAIEGNAEAFLKCLVVKEIFALNSKFMLGNFVEFLEMGGERFDLVFASGVLYHMMDPLKLIKLICDAADKSFLWSHYYDPALCKGYKQRSITFEGYEALHYAKGYRDRSAGRFWGGLAEGVRWLGKDDIVAAFKHFGHSRVEVIDDVQNTLGGPSFSLATWK